MVLGGAGACSPTGVGVVSGPGGRLSGGDRIAPALLLGHADDGGDLVEDHRVLDPRRESLAAAGGLDPGDDGRGRAASPRFRPRCDRILVRPDPGHVGRAEALDPLGEFGSRQGAIGVDLAF